MMMSVVIDTETNPVLGIDLGTTFSSVASWGPSGPRVYQTSDGKELLQSVVYLDPKSGSIFVGKQAYRRGIISPENVVIGIRRKSEILKRLYLDVQECFPPGKFKSRGTVVTVPYYFRANQVDNTKKAAELADIECMGILQEPIAASLYYAYELSHEKPDEEFSQNILVFDLGGETFDLTLLRYQQTKSKMNFEVLASGGGDRLGGMDFDECLVDTIMNKENISLEGQDEKIVGQVNSKLIEAAIDAKITLGQVSNAYVAIPDVYPGKHIDSLLSRDDFEKSIATYIEKIRDIIGGLWVNPGVNLRSSDVDRVLLVGGSSRIPCMRALLNDEIGEEKVWADANMDLCIVQGAALYAAYLDDKSVFDREFEFSAVTSHALGVKTAGGNFEPIIQNNKKTPCEHRMTFTTTKNNQEDLTVEIYQGNSRLLEKNTRIGQVKIPDLPKKPAGDLDINVTYKVSSEQELTVTVEVEGRRIKEPFNFL